MIDIAAHVRHLVQQAPPFTPQQLSRLRLVLTGAPDTREESDAA